MSQKTVRAGFYSPKRRLGKYETTIEDAFKQKRVKVLAPSEVSTISYVPDTVVVEDGVLGTVTLTLPTGTFDEDKQVVVVNKDAAETISVGGVTCAAASKSVIYFDGSSWVLLYEQSGVTTS